MPDWTKFYKVHRVLLKAKEPHIPKTIYQRYDQTITQGEYSVPIRVYPRKGSSKIIVYIHGGGWATENINTYHKTCRSLSIHCDATVVAIDYSLSPESKFPRATKECYLVVQRVIAKARKQGRKVILMGDSAGGNLCAVVSLMCRDKHAPTVDKLVLLYPVTYYDYTQTSPFRSVHDNATDYILTSKRMQEYITLYANTSADYKHPYFSPLCAKDFSNLPDTLILTAQYDPLRDEGEYYGKMLSKGGNNVKVVRMLGTMHGFFVHDKKAIPIAYKVINGYIN